MQQIGKKLFLRRNAQWTNSRMEAAEFGTGLEAIMFCIHCQTREVRFVVQHDTGTHTYLYPFGGDPAVKAERKNLRRHIRESRRLKVERRAIQARIDMLLAEQKEMKKQFSFKRKEISREESGAES